jgi:hypothetical protein
MQGIGEYQPDKSYLAAKFMALTKTAGFAGIGIFKVSAG